MSRTLVANGNVKPSRFVKQDTSAEGKCLQSGAGEKIFGVSHAYTHRAPLTGWDDGYAAIAGKNINVFTEGDECKLVIGGTVTVDDLLKADSDGRGVTTTTENDEIGAVALQSGTVGMEIAVRV